MSAAERHDHWRDVWISNRHRAYGVNCPGVDVDFLLNEYDSGQPRALVDYKCRRPEVLPGGANYTALRSLADASRIPFFLVFYSPSTRFFAAQPMNIYAGRFWQRYPELYVRVGNADIYLMSERRYVRELYRLRGRLLPTQIADGLSAAVPTMARWPYREPIDQGA